MSSSSGTSHEQRQPQKATIDKICSRGDDFLNDGRFKEAVKTYTDALAAIKGTDYRDPHLLINRATAFLELKRFEECLQDCEEYIKIMPTCWKGYTRKAVALSWLNKLFPALCSAAVAYYHDAKSCRQYEPFQSLFKDLDGNWAVANSSETLKASLRRNENSYTRKDILLLQDGEYEISSEPRLMLDTSLVAISNVEGVTLRTELLYLTNNCCFQNINFETKNGVLIPPQADMEFQRCAFHCSSADKPAIQVGGTASFLECNISNSKGGGIIVGAGPTINSSASLIKCRISGNGSTPQVSSGIRAFDNGILVVHECLVHGNTEGIRTYDSRRCVLAKEVKVTGSQISDNKYEGISVSGAPNGTPSSVVIQDNKIHHNGGHGLRVSHCVNDIRVQKNMVFENFRWGVWVKNNSGGCYEGNEICNNKMGGIRVGKQSPGKPACVVEHNVIRDNCGPAFHEEFRYFEGYSYPSQLQDVIEKQFVEKHMKQMGFRQGNVHVGSDISLPNMVTTEFKSNNECFQNGSEHSNLQTAASKPRCAYCFRDDVDVDLTSCKHCSVAMYCGNACQALHWRRHKYVCQAAGQRNFIDVSIPICEPGDVYSRVSSTHPGLESTDPRSADPPPRDGSRFIIKLQTHDESRDVTTFDSKEYDSTAFSPEKATVIVYDRSRTVEFEIADRPKIYHLIMEYGTMGASMYLSKRLYCWAAFKDDETLRIFTREFPPVQEW